VKDINTQGKMYLGHIRNIAGIDTGQELLYDPSDLTTHAVVVGMTGSGKTGLCVGMLEEAALVGLPALAIDPKGDITNLLLHFPDLAPQDFEPWINPDQARREGKSVGQLAEETAGLWERKLAEQGIGRERLEALQRSVEFTIFTPGSDAGVPVSILSSLRAPTIPWEGNRELLREKISGTVTALLGLVGLKDADPVRSREHILLSNIFEHAWSQGHDLDLGELILHTQSPPFAKLGVFDVNTFFPEKDRFGLAMTLNNMLAAPAFQTWLEGQPLDIEALLYTPEGQPRHSIFYLAHLPEAERMFFVTLLFSAVENWMRSQAGTTRLRAILYFDEIFGYLPPTANPPSKSIMLRLLKQARAFGVGLLLVTQNPVDLDYKALSNAGSWFIGKLQTDQDKQRLLDGLQGAAEGSLDRGEYDRLISTLGKRVFLLHNVHDRAPSLFETRWVMNYLAGPLTRAQIPALNKLARRTRTAQGFVAHPPLPLDEPQWVAVSAPPAPAAQAQTPKVEVASAQPGTAVRPALPQAIREYYLPNNLSLSQAYKAAGLSYPSGVQLQGLLYRPVVAAQASIRFLNRKYNLDYELRRTALVLEPDRRGAVRWENYASPPLDPADLDEAPDPQGRFAGLEAPFTDSRLMAGLQKDFLDWCYRTGDVTVQANEPLKVYSGPPTSPLEFQELVRQAAGSALEAERTKVTTSFDKKIEAIRVRLAREERELAEDQTRLGQRKMEEMGTHAENVFSLFSKRSSSRRLSTSLSKRRMTEQAKAAVEESVQAIQDFKRQIALLEKERDQAVKEVEERWKGIEKQVKEIKVNPLKKDVLLELFGVAWMPFYMVKDADRAGEVQAYGT
jgi:hypothetical protein